MGRTSQYLGVQVRYEVLVIDDAVIEVAPTCALRLRSADLAHLFVKDRIAGESNQRRQRVRIVKKKNEMRTQIKAGKIIMASTKKIFDTLTAKSSCRFL